MKDRKIEIIRAAEQIIPQRFSESSMQTAMFCEDHSGETVHDFLDALNRAANHTVRLQKEEGKGKLCYILFSHLYSSMFLQRYSIRIDMMDWRLYNDTVQCANYWDAENIYRLFEKDVDAIQKYVENTVPRIRGYEVDYIRYAYMPYYHRIAKTFIQEMISEAFTEDSFLLGQAERADSVKVLFGEYMGRTDVLYKIRG